MTAAGVARQTLAILAAPSRTAELSKIDIPTLVIHGEYDPIAPAEYQAKLYMSIATGHKQWVTVPGGDHAAFMETPRPYFIHELVSFLQGAP